MQNFDTDDLLFAPSLRLQAIETGADALFALPTPGEPNGSGVDGILAGPTFSNARGFYDAAFSLQVVAPDGADLIYTLDGSAPSTAHGTRLSSPAAVVLPISTTSLVRAMAVREGWADSVVVTHTYLFLNDVVVQPALPEGVPATWDAISEAAVDGDYEMDPEIVGDPAYSEDLLSGLREIPSLSVTLVLRPALPRPAACESTAMGGATTARRKNILSG